MHWLEVATNALILGTGATLFMDVAGEVLKRVFAVPQLSYALVGRWVLLMREGRYFHNTILQTPPVAGERLVGYGAHYFIGIVFAGVMLSATGLQWMNGPTPAEPLLTGVLSLAAPFLLMQPPFGFGIAASKTPHPWTARARSLMAHLSFGLGLYVIGLVLQVATG